MVSRLQRTGDPRNRAIEDRVEAALQRAREAASSEATAASSYTPASSADWNNDPPTTVQEALDRIAAALGPIT